MAIKGQKDLFTENFKSLMAEYADDFVSDELGPLTEVSTVDMVETDDTIDVLNQIENMAKYCMGHFAGYEDGVIDISIPSSLQAKEFAGFLDNFLPVDDYDCYEVINHDDGPDDHVSLEVDSDGHEDWSTVAIDSPNEFQFIVYLDDELVDGDDVLIDIENADPESADLHEVMKIVKINFKGKKVIRMKCQKGYKYSIHQHACVKREEHDLFMRRRKAQLNMLRRVASKLAIKKKIGHKSLRFLLNRRRLGIGY